ncbi:hypothetical protein [Flexivirga caeni]|uniref:DUF2269 family protein n=1 Tax=Flexivirga caeni TaxID=2294115 RepID=A0A3M9MEH3_9MICO|nr:hypothetical protein [Flexivirga caeni]RNI23233.1 hypothetical protein EFY87_07315 [Flexivirga caeni]
MLKLLLLLHLLTAIFAIGPLAHAVTTASRGLRHADAPALHASSRMAKIYAAASVLVVVFGMGLMSQKWHGKTIASMGDTWIWLSLLLWLAGVAITLLVVTPSLDKAAEQLTAASAATPQEGGLALRTLDLKPLTARVAASGGIVGLLFAVIVGLMVYRPGS